MMITPSGITISFGGARGRADDSQTVVARIYGFAQDGQGDPIAREMVVPAGTRVEQDLPQGLYNVELTLPSGRIIQRNVRIDEASNETYEFFDDFAKPAGFSLQESVGRDVGAIFDRALASREVSDRSLYHSAFAKVNSARGIRGRSQLPDATIGTDKTGTGFDPAQQPPIRVVEPTVSVGVGTHVALCGKILDDDAWDVAQPKERRAGTAIWHFTHGAAHPPDPATRRWARVTFSSGAIEVASLPLPWFCMASGAFVPVEMLVDPARVEGAATSLAVHDERLAGLLAFLDKGQAVAAGPMLQSLEADNLIEQTIYAKTSNPLAACAAAYVDLAVYPPDEREQWDMWLGNCMKRFPGVPDSAIVHARRLVLRPTSRESNAEAAEALRRACDAGVPFFSAGVGLLREMLVLLSTDFPDLAPLADQAARLAARVDAQQAFTVLRFAPQSTRKK